MPTETDIIKAHTRVQEADQAAVAARQTRDDLIRAAITEGMTAYRVAQILGIQQSAVAKIRHAK